MSGIQKIIKIFAMAFAIFLSFTIISSLIAAAYLTLNVVSNNSFRLSGDSFSFSLGSTTERTSFSEQWTKEEIEEQKLESIYVKCSSRIVLKKGEVLSVAATEVPETYLLSCRDGEISLTDGRDNHGINFSFFSESLSDAVVTITIPDDFVAKRIELHSGSGKLSAEDMECDRLFVDGGSGAIELSRISCNEFDLDTGSGHAELNDVVAFNTSMDTGSGSLEIRECKLGNLMIEGGSGRLEFEQVVSQNVNATSGSGKIVYYGVISGNCRFRSGSGSLNFRLLGNADDYSISVDTGSGGFWLDGKKKEDGTYGTNREGKLLFDTGSGRVTVDFE